MTPFHQEEDSPPRIARGHDPSDGSAKTTWTERLFGRGLARPVHLPRTLAAPVRMLRIGLRADSLEVSRVATTTCAKENSVGVAPTHVRLLRTSTTGSRVHRRGLRPRLRRSSYHRALDRSARCIASGFNGQSGRRVMLSEFLSGTQDSSLSESAALLPR